MDESEPVAREVEFADGKVARWCARRSLWIKDRFQYSQERRVKGRMGDVNATGGDEPRALPLGYGLMYTAQSHRLVAMSLKNQRQT